MQHKLTTSLSRIIPIAFATLGLAASSALAGTNISVGLSGKSFGNGQNLHVVSAGVLDASKAYTFTLEGTLKGSGDFSALNGLTLAQLADLLAPNGSSYLTKVKENSSGTLPVKKLYNRVFDGSFAGIDISFTLSSKITDAGKLVFDIKNVSVTENAVPLAGEITLVTGSKLTVTVAPEMRFNTPSQNVNENAGTVKVKALRFGYVGAPATVDYEMTNGTAIGGVDYKKASGSVSFAAGQTKQFIEIPIIDNNVLKDGKRSFKVTLLNPSKGAAVGAPAETTVNIINND